MQKKLIDAYELLEIRKTSYWQNIFGWLLQEKIAKEFTVKNINNNKSRKLIFT